MFWTVTLSILQGCGRGGQALFPDAAVRAAAGSGGGLRLHEQVGALPGFGLPAAGSAGLCPLALPAPAPVSALTNVIVWVIRGTPLILQLIIIFYGPGTWFGTNPWNAFRDGRMTACCIGLCHQLRLLLLRDLPGRH